MRQVYFRQLQRCGGLLHLGLGCLHLGLRLLHLSLRLLHLRLRLSDAGAGGHLLAQNCLIQLRGRLIVFCLSSLISSLSDIEITLRNHATL